MDCPGNRGSRKYAGKGDVTNSIVIMPLVILLTIHSSTMFNVS